ncbi:MAG: peptidylprolyl isomerase [Elusimicrobiota bacterium]
MIKKIMNKKIFLLFVFALAFMFQGLDAKEEVVDKVVARVNDEVILLSEYREREDAIIQEYEKVLQGPDKEKKLEEIREEILKQMIDEKLLLQKAEQEDIGVTEEEIEQGVQEIKARFESEEEFQTEIMKQGLSGENFKENVRDQIKVIKLINQEVKSKIAPPTEKEIKEYYKENEEEMVSPEQIRARHILIRTSEEKSQGEAKKEINEIYEKVKKNPGKFNAYAEKYSEGPSAKLGGDLGYFARGEMAEEFEKKAFNMSVGDISEPFKTRYGYHIVKVVGKKTEEKKSFTEVKDNLKNLIYQMRMEKEYEKFLRELRDEARISKSMFEKK